MTQTAEAEGPSYSQLRVALGAILYDRGEWAGAPMPVEGLHLSIESKHPLADTLMQLSRDMNPSPMSNDIEASGLLDGERLVNSWYCRQRTCEVYIVHSGDPACPIVRHFTFPTQESTDRLRFLMNSALATRVHSAETEITAMHALSELIADHQMRMYLLLGFFVERSKRSDVLYLFRRARPTLAIRYDGAFMKPLAALCLHPIGYYEKTHVGAMTPTDDVIAHLLMMRGDEPLFWRRSNQHNPQHPQAAL